MIAAWIGLAVGLLAVSHVAGSQTSHNLTLPGTGSTKAQDLLQDKLPSQANGTNPIVLQAKSGKLTDSKNKTAVDNTVKSLQEQPGVTRVISPLSKEGASTLSKDKTIGCLTVTLKESKSDLTEDDANKIIDATQLRGAGSRDRRLPRPGRVEDRHGEQRGSRARGGGRDPAVRLRDRHGHGAAARHGDHRPGQRRSTSRRSRRARRPPTRPSPTWRARSRRRTASSPSRRRRSTSARPPSSPPSPRPPRRTRRPSQPPARHGHPEGEDETVYVGGQTAGYIDMAARIADKLPRMIAIVVGLSFIVLMLAFRSILLPVKAAVANLLSVGAAYGVVTFVFQDGHGAQALGLDGAVAIVSYAPLLMFAILFGLSMDYEVFLLSQIQEHYEESNDTRQAVIDGLATTGRMITSAALIMVFVFSSFVLSGNAIVKQFGVGLAVAIAIDATVVRCLVVPAIMTLLGKSCWWLPRWMGRALPHISVEGAEYFAHQPAAKA